MGIFEIVPPQLQGRAMVSFSLAHKRTSTLVIGIRLCAHDQTSRDIGF